MFLRQQVQVLCLLAILLSACTRTTSTPAIESNLQAPTETIAVIPTRLPAASQTPAPEITITTDSTATTPPTLPSTTAPAQIPDPSGYIWVQVVDAITAPTDIQNAGDGTGRLFILEQPGLIRILQNGQILETPFLDISNRVGSAGSEQGLLGLAFHPSFSQNGYFFVNYTDQNGNTHISRFSANGDNTDPSTEKNLLIIQQPFPNHNGGALAFGPDGYLTIGLGDGGSAGDPYGNAQSRNTLLGKLLRLDVDQGEPYAIPNDNPYASSAELYKEIWATGLRNPWRFSFDRLTGDLWIGDVGQNLWEEIDFIPAGTPGGINFGWNKMESIHPFRGSNQPEYTAPVAEYPHGSECSVSGGYVYRGAALPAWQGVYLYGDYCSGAIWGLPSPPQGALPVLLFQSGFKISTFGIDETGELYIADYNGAIYRLEKRQ